ncbi:MAG: hypothetical protein BGO90_02690 [Legionella sp. 40-6]|nr:MAG: hypothetical protein BGO90_02690 [Legionella sp. 40-6]
MKKMALIAALFICAPAMANNADCSDAPGLWMGKFSYKDGSLCDLSTPELCQNVAIAAGIKKLPEANQFVADLYPQRGIGGSIHLECVNGQFQINPESGELPPGAQFTYKCDDLGNCYARYEDFRLVTKAIKMWQEDVRM